MKTPRLLALLLLLPGCPTPTQYGGPIAVDTEGFAVRMAWLCRWGMDGAKASACLKDNASEQGADAGSGASEAEGEGEEADGAAAPAQGADGGAGAPVSSGALLVAAPVGSGPSGPGERGP